MSNPIRLYFKHFSVGQGFSPIPYQQKYTRTKLSFWSRNIQAQLMKAQIFRGKDFPIRIKVKYFICKESYDANEFHIKTYWLLKTMERMSIIQSTNNHFLEGASFTVKTTIDPDKEGCEIQIIKKSEISE